MRPVTPLIKKLPVANITIIVLTTIIVFFAVELRGVNLRIPLNYARGQDASFYLMLTKTIVDHGWSLENPNLAAPDGMLMYDWPIPDNLPLFIIKLISLLTKDAGLVLNLYFLLTFHLSALTCLWALRTLGASRPAAVAASLLYAFIPGHLLRAETHLLLTTDFSIPLLVIVAFWAARGELSSPSEGGWWRSRFLHAALIMVIAGSCSLNYAFFGTYLVLVAGLIACFRERRMKPFLAPALLSLLMFVTILVNLAPNLLYFKEHGRGGVVDRPAADAERYGLKITQMIMPINSHRVRMLRRVRHHYNDETLAPLNNENAISSLGTLGSIAFLLLLAQLFGLKLPPTGPDDGRGDDGRLLGQLNLALILLATVGGFGSMIAIFALPQIRGYNRISLYVAFLAMLLLAALIDAAARRFQEAKRREGVRVAAAVVLTAFGLVDQTPLRLYSAFREINIKMYRADRAFARKIESMVPEGAMVFQLPYVAFPGRSPLRMKHYDHFRMYFHSKHLRWSYGAVAGRETDLWQSRVGTAPVEEMLAELKAVGFAGIYIDRNAYSDDDVSRLLREIRTITRKVPIVSRDKRRIFFLIGD